MPGEKRHAAGLLGGQEDLGANWKSAQCVTSLYDSYVQLQKENEQLREDARRFQQQNEQLAAQNKLQEPKDTRCSELEQEIQLLRSEKRRIKETHRLELQKLEARAASSETQHRQLVAKYQERFEFDPLEAKRAALAVKTMQNTLHNVMLEKEELGIRYGELKEQYRKFHSEQADVVDSLKQRVTEFEQQRAKLRKQRVVSTLALWSTSKMQNAWSRWIALAKEQRLLEQQEKMLLMFERQVDARVVKIRGNQAALLAMKLLQQAARRKFLRWRDWTREKLERRRAGDSFAEERSRRKVQDIVISWRLECQKAKDRRSGVLKVERLLTCSLRRYGVRKWRFETFRLALAEKDQRLRFVNGTMELQTKTIQGLEEALTEAQQAKRELQMCHEEEKTKEAAIAERKRATERIIRQKLGHFFTKQSDRHLLKDVVREWKTTAKNIHGVRQRTDLAQRKLRIFKLRRVVYDWQGRTHRNFMKRVQSQHILERMRHLSVLKCFNSWKKEMSEEKSRKAALLHAVNRIRSRGVARYFTQWIAFKEQRISLRRGIERMTTLATKQQVCIMFSSWKDRVMELKIEAQVQQQQMIHQAWETRLEQAKWSLNLQRECYTRWHTVVRQRQRNDIAVKKCLARLKNGFLAKTFDSWREFVQGRKTQRELIRHWVTRCHNGVLQRAWNRLQRQIMLKERQLLMLRLQKERDAALEKLEAEFELYRNQQQTLLAEAERVQTEQDEKLQVTRIRLEKEAKRAQRFASAVETLCLTRGQGSAQLRCLKAWRNVVRRSLRNRQTVDMFQTALDTRQIRAVVTKWKQVTIQQRRLRSVFTMTLSCFLRWWQVECFKAWKETRQRSRAIRVFSTWFIRKSEMNSSRQLFTEWRRLVRQNQLLRKMLEKIWLKSFHATVRQQFLRWVELTRTNAAKEQLEKRNVALTVIRAKVWWKQSVSIMRFCFTEWKESVESKKKQHLAERKLILFEQTRLVTVCFKSWLEFVVLRTENEDRNQQFARWLRNVQRRKQQCAMARWKMLLIRNQQRELQDLTELRNAQQEKLQLQREEIASLMQTIAETKHKLAHVTHVHDESTTKMQLVMKCGLVAKYFNALKLNVSIRRYQRQAVLFSQKNAHRRHLAEILSNWCSFSQNYRSVKLIVAQKAKRCRDSLGRSTLRRWHFVAVHQRVTTRKQRKLQLRVRERVIRSHFAEWYRSIHRGRNISIAMDQLEIVARRLKLMHTLHSWHHKCLQERNRALRESEKHKKFLQFLILRQEASLVRTFQALKNLRLAKQTTHSLAQQHYTQKCRVILTKCWHSWCSTVQTIKLQRNFAVCVQMLIKRYYYRAALSRWRRYRFMSQITTLQSGNEELSNQVADSMRQLQSTSMNVEKLSAELMKLQDKLYEAESRLSAVSAEITLKEAKRSTQLNCLSALSKIMLKRSVSREVLEVFTLWKGKLSDIRRKHRTLSIVAKIRRRRKKLLAFWFWKVKTLRWRQLDTLKKLWGRNNMLVILQRWRKYSTTQAKLRLLLTKRCLLSYTNRCLPISIAFRLWKIKSTELAALQEVVTLHTKLQSEQISSSTHLRRLTLGKWCWIAYHHRLRQMRAFLSRCYVHSIQRNAAKHRRVIEEIQLHNEAALAKVTAQSEVKAQEEMTALSAAEEQLTAGSSFQALQTLIRQLFQPMTVRDLCISISSTFAQIVHGSAAILFLFDPSSNELWTQREENQLIQVPASLGIAGSTLSSGSTLIITDIAADPRFHPMVDQFVMNGLRKDDTSTALMMATSRPSPHKLKATLGMVSSALVSTDGAVYGVLQVAFPTSSPSLIDRRVLVTQTQLYSKICCFYAEQIVFDMLRNCRDRVRARAPDKFIKLFKQNKNWRKYYTLIERKAAELANKLREVLEEREELIQSKDEMQKRHQQVKDKLESSERNTKDVRNLMNDWKKKLAKWQKALDEKDHAIVEKTSELKKVEREFERYRRERRSKDLQSVLKSSPSAQPSNSTLSHDEECADESTATSPSLNEQSQISILRADQTRLKSQLVRAEADNLLLVKAISIARTQHGDLPRTIQAEVTRVATRISRRVPPQA